MAAEVTVKFDTDKQAIAFMEWLCESGEQGYWEWADCRDQPEFFVSRFDYNYNLPLTITGQGVM